MVEGAFLIGNAVAQAARLAAPVGQGEVFLNAHGGGRTHHGVLKYTAEEARALMLGQVREVEAV